MSKMKRRDVLILSTGAALSTVGRISNAHAAAATSQVSQAAPSGIGSPQQVARSMHGLAGVKIPRQVTVLGAGGSGCWAALFAALSGVEEMLLLDAADVSDDDMGRTLFRPRDVGRPKAEAVAEIISMFRPAVKARPVKRFVQPTDKDIYFGAVLFDGVDYKPLNEILPAEARQRNMIYTQGFFSGLGAGVVNEHFKELNWTKGGETPVWPASAALCGVLQCYSAFVRQFNFFGNPSQLNTPTAQIMKRLAAAGPRLKLAL